MAKKALSELNMMTIGFYDTTKQIARLDFRRRRYIVALTTTWPT